MRVFQDRASFVLSNIGRKPKWLGGGPAVGARIQLEYLWLNMLQDAFTLVSSVR
jgi:hypothetical protein